MGSPELFTSPDNSPQYYTSEYNHQLAIEGLQQQVIRWNDEGRPGLLKFVSDSIGTNLTAQRGRNEEDYPIIASGFNRIVGKIDQDCGVVKVGPRIAVGSLLRATTQEGLMPLIRPGFPALTPQADTVDHTTWKYGMFGDTYVSKTLLMPDGGVFRVDHDHHPELFYGTNVDYRTFATVLDVEIQLKELSPYIHMTFFPAEGAGHAIQIMQDAIVENKASTIEAIAYGPGEAVAILGRETSDPGESDITTFRFPGDQWFHRFAREAKGGEIVTDIISASERFRYGAYWMGEYIAKKFGEKDKEWIRRLHDNFAAEELYDLMGKIGNTWQFFIQDYIGPIENAPQLLNFIEEKGIYPIWLNPVKPTLEERKILQPNLSMDEQGEPRNTMLIEIGPYGRPGPPPYPSFPSFKKHPFDPVELGMEAEEVAYALGFDPMFYADRYSEAEKFWSLHDKKRYDSLRKTWGAEDAYPDIYTKTHYPEGYSHQRIRRLRGLTGYIMAYRSRGTRQF